MMMVIMTMMTMMMMVLVVVMMMMMMLIMLMMLMTITVSQSSSKTGFRGISMPLSTIVKHYWLVVRPPLRKNMKVNWDDEIPNIWENAKFMATKPPTK